MERRQYNQGPTRMADAVAHADLEATLSRGEIPSLIKAKAPPAPRVEGRGHQLWVRLATTFAQRYAFEPPLGGRVMSPSPTVYVDPGKQLPDVVRVDWRRPNAVIPGSFLP